MAHVTGLPNRRSRPFRINVVITPAVHERNSRNLTLPSAIRCLRRKSSSSTGFAAHHERPGEAGHFVGERNRDNLERSSCQHLCDPGKLLWMKLGTAQDRHRAHHQDPPQVTVALFGYRPELGLSPCRHLSWHHPDPSRKVTP